MKQEKQVKACERCGYRRLVRIYDAGTAKPFWSHLCRACDHLRSAEVHDAASRHQRRLARAIFDKRALRTGRHVGTTAERKEAP